MVDGQVRFAPDQPSSVNKNQQIVNFIDIDSYMINKKTAGKAAAVALVERINDSRSSM
jgi:hypothetical protein